MLAASRKGTIMDTRGQAAVLLRALGAVGKVDSRKRLQKSFFLLQQRGCPLGFRYHLHLYGPYSPDVANLTDALCDAHLVEEQCSEMPWGRQYSYELKPEGKQWLQQASEERDVKEAIDEFDRYAEKFKALMEVSLWVLEVGATLAYYRASKQMDWEPAVDATARLKEVQADSDVMEKAQRLAKEYVSSSD